MNKKLTCLVLVLVSCSFVGCGNSKQQANESDQSKSTQTQLEQTANNNQVGDGYFKINESKKIQLIGAGNEDEKPFLVKKIESNASHITIFTLEDGRTRVVNCEYKEVK